MFLFYLKQNEHLTKQFHILVPRATSSVRVCVCESVSEFIVIKADAIIKR